MFKILELSSDYYAQGPRFVSTFQPTYSFNYVSKGLLIHVSVKLASPFKEKFAKLVQNYNRAIRNYKEIIVHRVSFVQRYINDHFLNFLFYRR